MINLQEKDKIPDSSISELEFSPHVNPDGNKLHHLNGGVYGESQQRAKLLTRLYQQKEGTEKIQQLEA